MFRESIAESEGTTFEAAEEKKKREQLMLDQETAFLLEKILDGVRHGQTEIKILYEGPEAPRAFQEALHKIPERYCKGKIHVPDEEDPQGYLVVPIPTLEEFL